MEEKNDLNNTEENIDDKSNKKKSNKGLIITIILLSLLVLLLSSWIAYDNFFNKPKQKIINDENVEQKNNEQNIQEQNEQDEELINNENEYVDDEYFEDDGLYDEEDEYYDEDEEVEEENINNGYISLKKVIAIDDYDEGMYEELIEKNNIKFNSNELSTNTKIFTITRELPNIKLKSGNLSLSLTYILEPNTNEYDLAKNKLSLSINGKTKDISKSGFLLDNIYIFDSSHIILDYGNPAGEKFIMLDSSLNKVFEPKNYIGVQSLKATVDNDNNANSFSYVELYKSNNKAKAKMITYPYDSSNKKFGTPTEKEVSISKYGQGEMP